MEAEEKEWKTKKNKKKTWRTGSSRVNITANIIGYPSSDHFIRYTFTPALMGQHLNADKHSFMVELR